MGGRGSADPHLLRTLKELLERAAFEVAPPQVVPLCNVGFDPATYSAVPLEGVAGFVVRRDGRNHVFDGSVASNVHLCRHRFAPVSDPQRFPVCPRCKELAGMLGIGG